MPLKVTRFILSTIKSSLVAVLVLYVQILAASAQQIVIADFEQPKPGANSNYNSLTSAFPNPATGSTVSAIANSNGTAGFFINGSIPTLANYNAVPTPDGNNFIGLHSDDRFPQEVARITLLPSIALTAGTHYIFEAIAHRSSFDPISSFPSEVFDSPGYVDIYGIRTGANPTLNGTTQNNSSTIANLTGVDLLGTFGLVTSSTVWETFTFNHTAAYNYDRLLIVPRGVDLVARDDTFIFLDTLVYDIAALDIVKTATPLTDVGAGDGITYTYDVTNTGTTPITNVSIVDVHNGSDSAPVPNNEQVLTDVAPLGDSVDAGNDGTWDTLGPNDVVRFTASYTVTQTDIDTLQ